LARRSNSAQSSCGKSSTNTKSLVKNHNACTLCTLIAITTAAALRAASEPRMSPLVCSTDRVGHTRRLQQFHVNMALADRIEAL